MARFDLQFPSDLLAEDTTMYLGGLAADLSRSTAVASVIGAAGRISHSLELIDRPDSHLLSKLNSLLPNIRVSESEPSPKSAVSPCFALELRLTTTHRQLRTDRQSSVATGVMGAIAAAGVDERVELRWVLRGARTPSPARRVSDKQRAARPLWLGPTPPTWHREAEGFQAEKLKQSQPLFLAVARIGVWASSVARAHQLAQAVVRSLRAAESPGVKIRVRLMPASWALKRFESNNAPRFDWPMLINASELCSVIGWPIEGPRLPGLKIGASRQLPPSLHHTPASRDGAVIADTTFPGVDRPVVVNDRDRTMHQLVLGPTGSGKSVAIGHVALSDMRQGHGLIVIDPKGDLVDYLTDHVPDQRRQDVIVFDPANDNPVGYNPLLAGNRPSHLVVDQVDHIFAKLFGSNYGPRSGDINRAALLTLMSSARSGKQYTMAELPLLLTNTDFRRSLTSSLSDSTLVEFWRWYEQLGGSQATVTAPILNKYRQLLLKAPIRNVLGQGEPGWTLEDVIQQRKILLIRLSAGEIGSEAAHLLGSLLVAGIWQATQSRTQVPLERRRFVSLIIDEWQNFLRLPTSLGDMLAQARGLGLGLTLANQQLGQLSKDLQADVLSNARTKIVFQTGVQDARSLAPQLQGVRPEDLQHLGPFEIVAQLAVGSTVTRSVSGKTRPPEEPTGNGAAIKLASARKFGRPVSEIEEEISDRIPSKPSAHVTIGKMHLTPDQEGEGGRDERV